MTEKTILVTSRDTFMGSILVNLVKKEHMGTVCSLFSDGYETLKAVDRLHPSVLILDMFLPHLNGLSFLRELQEHSDRPYILAYCHNLNSITGVKAVKLGCTGLADFSYTLPEAREALDLVSRGVTSYPRGVQQLIDNNDYEMNPQKYTPITTRQSQVVGMAAMAKSNLEISYELDISIKTVEKHKRVIKEKYGLFNAAELAHFAIRHGIIEKEEGICM